MPWKKAFTLIMNKPESLDTRFDGSDEFNSDQLLTTLQLKVIYLEVVD